MSDCGVLLIGYRDEPEIEVECTAEAGLRDRARPGPAAGRSEAGRPGGYVRRQRSWRPAACVPDLTEANLRDRDSAFRPIRDTLGSLGGRSRDVIALLPDAAVRVVLLDFDTLPTSRQEAKPWCASG